MSDQVESAADGEASHSTSRGQPLITSRERLWLVVILVWFMLIAAAITAPVAIALFRPPRQAIAAEIRLSGDEVAGRQWPTRTPHDEPWPALSEWHEARGLGFRYVRASSPREDPQKNSFSMEIRRYGFPFPIVEHADFWWDWGNTALAGPESSPALRLLWPGLILNPVIIGGAAYLILMAPVVTFILGKRLARRGADRCLYCGYPRGASAVCTECGKTL